MNIPVGVLTEDENATVPGVEVNHAREVYEAGLQTPMPPTFRHLADFSQRDEVDPYGRDPHQPGAKMDHGKSPVFQGLIDYFPLACMAVADISAFGASKYAWKGWETVPDGFNRYSNALARHLCKEGTGETHDPDSGRLHAAHTAWNAMARLEKLLRDA